MEIYQAHKIALIGTSSTGKSTLYDWCVREIADSGCAVIPEAATRYFEAHDVPEPLRFTEKVQTEIQSLAIEAELGLMAAALMGGLAVAFLDRCVLCAAVYVRSTGDIEGSDRLYRRVQPFLQTYSRLYLLDPAGVPFQQNNVRTEDRATRDHIHETYLRFLEEKGIPYQLLSGTEDERKKTVMDYVMDLVMGSVAPDNVSGSPRVALRNRYILREGTMFDAMCTALRSVRHDVDAKLDLVPEEIRSEMAWLLVEMYLASNQTEQGGRGFLVHPTIVAHDAALHAIFTHIQGAIPLRNYSLEEARRLFRDDSYWEVNGGTITLSLPTKIEGLLLNIHYPLSHTTGHLTFELVDLE